MTPSMLELLTELVRTGASDLHVRAMEAPAFRLDGALRRGDRPELTVEEAEEMVTSLMIPALREKFAAGQDVDFAVEPTEGERFRVNAFRFRGRAGAVLRRVAPAPLTLDQLDMPPVLHRLALQRRGLTLVCGPTGSGKTTTLGAIAEEFNRHVEGHILTLEDPIEILIPSHRSVVTQREVRADVEDFPSALRSAMRQDPDLIVMGELRDEETVRAAMVGAETGHHVLATLHTTDTTATVHRIIDLFPPGEQKQIRLTLAAVLNGIVCQRLAPRASGGRVGVTEIAVNTGLLGEAIADPNRTHALNELVAAGGYHGMHTFNQDLLRLLQAGEITWAAAQVAASDPHDLEVEVRRAGLLHLTMAS